MTADEAMAVIRSAGKKFYCYLLCRPCGSPFYVGVGTGRRILDHAMHARKRGTVSHKLGIIRKVHQQGGEIGYEIVGAFADRRDAEACEVRMIGILGRADLGHGPLANLTGGGEGAAIIVGSIAEQRRERIKQSWSTRPAAARAGALAGMHTAESQARAVAARAGVPRGPYSWKGPKGWKACRVEVDGIEYASIKDAADANGVTDMAVHRWLREDKRGARRLPRFTTATSAA